MQVSELDLKFKENLRNGQITLDKTIIIHDQISSFLLNYLNIFNASNLQIQSARIESSDKSISIIGKTSIFNIEDSDLQMRFLVDGDQLSSDLKITFPPSCKLDISAGSQLAIGNVVLFFNIDDPEAPVTGEISGVIHFDSIDIPLSIKLPVTMEGWHIKGNFENIPLPGLSDIAKFFGGSDLTGAFPIGLDQAIKNLSLTDFEILYIPQDKRVALISQKLISKSTWEIIPPNLSIREMELFLSVLEPMDQSKRDVNGHIRGIILIGDVRVDIGISKFGGGDIWALRVGYGERIPLPSISEILLLAGGGDMAGAIPEELLNLGKITLNDLDVQFDSAKKSISSFSIALAAYDAWQIPGISDFAIKDLNFYLEMENPADEAQRRIDGNITGTMDICSTDVNISGNISDTFVLTTRIPQLSLSAIINQFMQGFSFPASVPDLEFADLDLSITPKTGEFSFSGISSTPWALPLGFETAEISDVYLSLNRTAETAGQRTVSGEIKGTMKLGEASFDIDYKFPGDFVLQGRIDQMDLLGLAEEILQGMGVPDDLPDLIFKDIDIYINPQKGEFDISGRSSSSWSLPMGTQDLQIQDLFLRAKRSVSADGASQVSGRICGLATIAGTSVKLDLQLEKTGLVLSGTVERLKFSSLVQDLCGNQSAQNTLMPPGIQALDINNLQILLDVSQKTFSVYCNSGLGEVEVLVKKVEAEWGFIFGLIPPQNWQFSAISQDLASLDAIKFENTAVIVSSTEDASFSLTRVQTPRKNLKIIRGLNLFVGMDLSSVHADAILGKTSLEIYAAVGTTLSDLVLETKLAGDIQLSQGLILGGIIFRLKPNPADFSLQLLCFLKATLSGNVLEFAGAIIVGSTSARMAATMLGVWNQPFGFQGVAIANVALSLGITYTIPPIPTVGIAGSLEVGEFKGSAAVQIDACAPTKSMVAVEFNRLYLIDVLKTFCNPSLGTAIPDDVIRTVLNIGFEDSKVYIVPQPTQIGELKYEQGFKLASKMFFQGIRGYADLNIDYAKGIDVKGDVDVINLGEVFILRGTSGNPKAAMALSIMPQTNPIPVMNLNGEVLLLGLSCSVDIQFSKDGFFFRIDGKIFSLFEASLEVKGDISKLQGIYLKAYMKNDLFKYLRENAERFIKSATDSAVSSLTKAQNDINNAQQNVNGLLIRINDARVVVDNERQTAINKLQSARSDLDKAQSDVNLLQWQIDQAKNQIRSYENDINWWNSWYNNSRWYQKSYRWAQLSYEVGWRGTAIAGLYATIGGLETAKLAAIGVLEAAKLVLRGLEAIVNTPVDLDPRVAVLLTAYAAATTALSVANGALELLKKALGGMANVATFIINAGLGGILDIRRAEFEGLLSLSSGAKISMRIDLTFMDGPVQTYQLDFDFKNPISAVESLVKRALPGG